MSRSPLFTHRYTTALGLLLCLWFSAQTSVAQPGNDALVLHSGLSQTELLPYLSYWRDPQGNHTLASVMAQDSFRPASELPSLNLGYTPGAVWLRLSLQGQADIQRWLLEMDYSYLDDIQLFVVNSQGKQQAYRAGRHIAMRHWPIAARTPRFPLQLADGEHITLYLRAQTHASLALGFHIRSESESHLKSRQQLFFQALYFGILLALGLYNLLLWTSIRQPSFLLYSLFELSFGLAASSMNGIAPLLLWPEAKATADFVVPTFYTLATMLGVLFARSFLQLQQVSLRWQVFLSGIAVLLGVATLATLLVPAQLALKIMGLAGLITTVSLLAAGIAAMRYRVHAAGIFVAAWALLLVGTSLLSIRNAGLLPSNILTVYSMQIGSALEMLLLSFALGARFNRMKMEKEQAQQALVSTLQQQERILEKRVLKRTEELLDAKARLEHLVTHDPLTGLLNRSGLRQHFGLMQQGDDASGSVAVILIDLDGFKPVNDTHGHEAGDQLLQQVAKQLTHAVAEGDVCARLGGDEFVVLARHRNHHELLGLCEQLGQQIAQPHDLQLPHSHASVSVQASIGACNASLVRCDLSDLLRRADDAMYRVKRSGKNGVCINGPVHDQTSSKVN